jgi:NAD(P)-dependent dehydrogenase (short-subunit alcohol dehydrogenase family)
VKKLRIVPIDRREEGNEMSKKVWFITGASRGIGVQFAKAALAAGHAVVASGRDTVRVSQAVGQSNDLLAVKLDVTSRADADAAVRAAAARFGRIDVLVNNAASFYAGYCRLRVRECVRRVEVRSRGLDGVAAGRGRAVRHQHHRRQPRVLPH